MEFDRETFEVRADPGGGFGRSEVPEVEITAPQEAGDPVPPEFEGGLPAPAVMDEVDAALAQAEPGAYADTFIALNKAEISERISGPEGTFAKLRVQARSWAVAGHTALEIQEIPDRAHEQLFVGKAELVMLAGAICGRYESSEVRHFRAPTAAFRIDDIVYTEEGEFQYPFDESDGPNDLPPSFFEAETGTLWLMPTAYVDQYPHILDRRIAVLWDVAHGFAQGVLGDKVERALRGEEGTLIIRPDATETDSSVLIQDIAAHLPERPITEYSAMLRATPPEGTDALETRARAIEAEICETVAATVLGFAPTPGRAAAEALERPFAGREEFQRKVWDLVEALH